MIADTRGRVMEKIKRDATNEEIISKINEIVELVNRNIDLKILYKNPDNDKEKETQEFERALRSMVGY